MCYVFRLVETIIRHQLLIISKRKMPINNRLLYKHKGDRGSTMVKVLCYNSEGHWFDPSWCQWIFH